MTSHERVVASLGRRAVSRDDLEFAVTQAGGDLEAGQLAGVLAQRRGQLGLAGAPQPDRALPQAPRGRRAPPRRRVGERGGPHRLQLARRSGQHQHRRAGCARPRPARPVPARCRPGPALRRRRAPSPACGSPPRSRPGRPASRRPALSRSTIAAMRCSSCGSSCIGRPWNAATTSAVRSSAVGPRPPDVMMRSTPLPAMNASAARRSSGRSPTTTMCATSTPTRRSCSASQGPLRSATRPVSTSVPVTTMPARVAIRPS